MKQIKSKLAKLREYLSGGCCECPKGCFECCTKIFFNPEEKKRMDRLLRERGIKEPPNGEGNDYCEYLDDSGKCSVYEERPIVCRAFGVVDTPFCFCEKTKQIKKIPESEPLKHYMASEKVFNKGYEYGDKLNEGIKNAEPWAIIEVLYQSITLFNIGKISKDRLMAQYNAFNNAYMAKNEGRSLHEVFPELMAYYNAIKNGETN